MKLILLLERPTLTKSCTFLRFISSSCESVLFMVLETATSLNFFFVSVARSISLFAVSSGLSDHKLFVPHKITILSGLSPIAGLM